MYIRKSYVYIRYFIGGKEEILSLESGLSPLAGLVSGYSYLPYFQHVARVNG